MKRAIKVSLHTAAGLGLFLLAALAQAGQAGAFDFDTYIAGSSARTAQGTAQGTAQATRDPRLIQIASPMESQSATMPVGTIRLRVIPEVGGKAVRERIHWRVMTYGKDDQGKRHQVAEVTDATPELVLPAGWYVVHAEMKGKTIKHPVEVTAGKTFKYTLVKQ